MGKSTLQWLYNMSIKQIFPRQKQLKEKQEIKDKIYISITEFRLTPKALYHRLRRIFVLNGKRRCIYTLGST